ncbi:MAG: efflux RND transporter periplasmic adaptor subunit [Gammaproteobacteria bacterium]
MNAGKQGILILIVIAVGLALAAAILGTDRSAPAGDEHGDAEGTEAHEADDAHAAGPRRGPHGGKLFVDGAYGLELAIDETGSEPRFRIYTYLDGKPLAPAASEVRVKLARLGRDPELFVFTADHDALTSEAVVDEPHSFELTIEARHAGESHRFDYTQIEARVRMTQAQLARNGVEVLSAGPARIRSVLALIGEIRFDEDRLVHVVPRLGGVVEDVAVKLGDRVHEGQRLARISSQALSDQRSELLAARKRLALARSSFGREEKLWREKIAAEQDYLQARHALQEAEIAVSNAEQKLKSLGGTQWAAADLTGYEVIAPIDGIVIEKHIALGEAVKEDASVFVIADLSTVWAEMTIHAKDLNTVRVGQAATVRATAFESESTGTVSYVGPLVGEQTRTAKARLVLPNPAGVWRPGLPVEVELVADEVEVPIAVSTLALQTVGERTVVFGRYGEDFEARPVRLGRNDGAYAEVLEGLRAGERYAAANSFLIKAELGKAGAEHEH